MLVKVSLFINHEFLVIHQHLKKQSSVYILIDQSKCPPYQGNMPDVTRCPGYILILKWLIVLFRTMCTAAFLNRPLKSDNLQYNTVGWLDDVMIVPPSDGPMFILIDWESFSKTVAQWIWLREFQTVHYRITLRIKFHFLHNFLQNFLQNYFKLLSFIFLQLKFF